MADRSLTLVFLGKDAGASATAEALAAKLKALQKVTDENTRSQDNLNKKYGEAKKAAAEADRGMSGLLLTALELAPAMIPIGAVGVGALAGLVPAAGAALLAFLGLKDAWAKGTLQATAFGHEITAFQGEFAKLKDIAAGGVLSGFTKAMQDIQPLFPAVNRDVALFSSQLGQSASHTAPGLVQMFLQLQPLFQTFGNLLVQGSEKFQQWATSGNGIKNFVAYVQSSLPAVMQTLNSLVHAASALIQGFAPFGSTSLQAIKLFSNAINAIPIGVLQTLVPLLAGAALGLKAFKEASAAAAGIQAFASKLEAASGIAGGAGKAVGTLGKVVGFLGPVGVAAGVGLGLLSAAMGVNSQKAVEQQRRVNDLTQAIQDGSAATVINTQLQSSGAEQAASKYGTSLQTLHDVVIGNTSATQEYDSTLNASKGNVEGLGQALAAAARSNDPQAYIKARDAYDEAARGQRDLKTGVSDTSKAYQDALKNVAQYTKASGDSTLSADIMSGATARTAASLGMTQDAYISAKLAADKKTASDQAQTNAMILEGDAAGLLTNEFNKLNDVMLSATDASLAFKLGQLQLADALKQSKNDMSQNTEAGIQNNQMVLQQIRLAEQDGEQLAKSEQGTKGLTAATRDGTARTLADLQALRSHVVAAHGNTDAIDGMIRKLQGYNATPVPPKPMKVDDLATARIHAVQQHLAAYNGTTATASVYVDNSQAIASIGAVLSALTSVNSAKIAAVNAKIGAAAGGYITGPGSGTSDSIPARLSNGEFVMPADVVSRPGMLGLLQSMRLGGPPRAGQSQVAMSAGRGGGNTNVYVTVQAGLVAKASEIEREITAAVVRATNQNGPANIRVR